MGILSDWGFRSNSWQGQRGEYWVLAQALLMLGFVALPVYRPFEFSLSTAIYGLWTIAALLGLIALVLISKGFWDLGHNLTPLPHPKDDGELVQSGVYRVVRHPLYSGLIFAATGWALYLVSVSHLAGVIGFFVFFNAKASREEAWLTQKYPEYAGYREKVKKLVPWLY